MAQKCEWVTHTLRGPDTPPWGACWGPCPGWGGAFVQWALGHPVIPRSLGPCVPVSTAGTQGVDRGWPVVEPGGGPGDLRLPDGVWMDAGGLIRPPKPLPQTRPHQTPVCPSRNATVKSCNWLPLMLPTFGHAARATEPPAQPLPFPPATTTHVPSPNPEPPPTPRRAQACDRRLPRLPTAQSARRRAPRRRGCLRRHHGRA